MHRVTMGITGEGPDVGQVLAVLMECCEALTAATRFVLDQIRSGRVRVGRGWRWKS